MYQFDAVIRAYPTGALFPQGPALGDCSAVTLVVDPTTLTASFACTFEEVGAQLEQFPRCFFEPDGYFVWRGDGWQLDGVIYDRADHLISIEVRGACPQTELERLLSTVGWPEQRLLFELPRAAGYVDEENFRRYAVHSQG